jgi:undecaprenyl-diphosphatase
MNDLVQDWINDPAGKFALLDAVMKLSARDLVYLVPPLLLVMWFWPASERALNQRLAVATTVAAIVALGLASVVAHFVFEARPFISDGDTHLLIQHAADNGFPSDHTTLAFAVAGAILVWHRSLGVVCLVLAAALGIARVYVGVHWPSDVIGGAVVGLVAGVAVARCVPLLEQPQRLLSRVLPSQLIAAP